MPQLTTRGLRIVVRDHSSHISRKPGMAYSEETKDRHDARHVVDDCLEGHSREMEVDAAGDVLP
jgi:hypothetical protein